MITVCHKVISLVYSVFQYIIGDGILLSWTGPCAFKYPKHMFKLMDEHENAIFYSKFLLNWLYALPI